MADSDPASRDPRLLDSDVRSVWEIFRRYGHEGQLLVVDDNLDEAIFIIPPDALLSLQESALSESLQALLGRKVWVVGTTPIWLRRARPLV
jgi:hypothetical protein